jgi:VCBS repeat-containing protein
VGFTGVDTFTVTASDATGLHWHGLEGLFGGGHTSAASYRIAIADIDQPPVADPHNPFQVDVVLDGVVYGRVNVTDPNGTALSYAVGAQVDPVIGRVRLIDTTSGRFEFTPTLQARIDAHLNPATVGFTITATDGTHTTAVAVSGVPIAGLNVAPVADPLHPVQIDPAGPGGVVSGRVKVTDPNGGPLSYALLTQPDTAIGTVSLDTTSGRWEFTPTLQARIDGFLNPVTVGFTVTATDGTHTTAVPVSGVPITGLNVAPVLSGQSGPSAPDLLGRVTGSFVVTDPNGGPLTAAIAAGQGPAYGTVVETFDVATGTYGYTYTPNQAGRLRAGLGLVLQQ